MNELLNKYPEQVRQIVARYPAQHKRAAIMPLLYLAQSETGYVSKRAITEIAEIAGVLPTEVASVLGFYTLFHDEQEAAVRYRVQVCTDLPCALRGAEEFLGLLCERMGVRVGEAAADGSFLIEEVKCLAGCHRAPMFQVQGDGEIVYHEHQTVESAAAVLEALRNHAREKEAQG